jgi:signal transduction histidine kinase
VLESLRARRMADVEQAMQIPVQRLGIASARTALFAPLVYRGRPLGVLAAFDRLTGDAQFTADDEALLEAFAASAAIAVATAQNVESDRLRRSMQAAEAERRLWARELHDETLQGLGALGVLLGSASRMEVSPRVRPLLDAATEQVRSEIANLRAIITDLRPAALDELGLVPALASLARRTESRAGLEMATNLADLESLERLPGPIETTVYRIAQEALTNVAKHAGATTASLTLHVEDGTVAIEVTDDGAGFDPEAVISGFGLVGMRERVELARGSLEISHLEGRTVLRARVPIPR